MIRDEDSFEDYNDVYLYTFVDNISTVGVQKNYENSDHDEYVVDDTNEWYNNIYASEADV